MEHTIDYNQILKASIPYRVMRVMTDNEQTTWLMCIDSGDKV